jgi:hypothetical protein
LGYLQWYLYKYEIRISKSETNPNYQNPNDQNQTAKNLDVQGFEHSSIRILNLFRASFFGFTIHFKRSHLIESHTLLGSLETFAWPTAEIHRLSARPDPDDIAAPFYDKRS